MKADVEIRGERILLRDLRPEDCLDIFEYASDPAVTRFAGWEAHRTLADSVAYIRRCLDARWPPITFAVEHAGEGRLIGVVDIRVVSRFWGIGEIGYTIGRHYWGQGFNLEAGGLLMDYGFEVFRLRRIRASCDTRNRRSFRTMEKLGMRRAKLLRGVASRDGSVADRYVYSIRRREWASRVL